MTTVVFVCQHGAAKSVLAAHELERLAIARGFDADARAFGVEPDEAVAPGVIEARPDLETELRSFRPRALSADALRTANLVVLIGVDPGELPPSFAPRGSAVERWDDIPAVSDGPETARQAIDRRIEALLDDLEAGGAS